MAFPPPLPAARRAPPPLPARAGRIADPYATMAQFDEERDGVSTRDVLRASGKTVGVWIATNSQAVNRMRYDPDMDQRTGKPLNKGTITIEYLNLSMYEFPGRPLADWMDLFESSSKGRFNWYVIRKNGWQFRKLRGPQRKVTAKMLHTRAPRGNRQGSRTYTVGGRRGAFGAGGLPVR